ncbi:MAG: PKD domain-containing protein [Candidatus Krumholzibacteria bacterium]|nr:PKD domain-containing protein [Candidatus Krumholzibacteria bacterium]
MNRLLKSTAQPGILVLVFMLMMVFLTSCGSDDPVAPTNTNDAPATAAIDTASGAPAHGATSVALATELHWTCTDPDSDPLTYSVHFGEDAAPPVVSTDQVAISYSLAALEFSTTYNWQIVAADPDGKTSTSAVWSFTTVAADVELVSTPDAPSGPNTGLENEDLTYSGSNAESNQGHDVEYRFNWGDGQISDWASSSIQHSWPTADSYDVISQARCIEHPAIESEWSAATTVVISAYGSETVSAPTTPTGSATGETDQSLTFATGGAVSSEGHTVNYSFDWGNGAISSWSAVTSRSYSWDTAGTYLVKVQARCVDHTTVVSAWSETLTVTITAAAGETVSAPDAPGAPATETTGVAIAITISGGASSLGHSLQYRIDFGNGISNWYTGLTSIQRTYVTAGTFDILAQARCLDHPAIESEWSAATSIVISDPDETIPYPPGSIMGVTNGAINESYEYNVFHSSTTNLGHAIEGRFEWGDGTFSPWNTESSNAAPHAWTVEGTYVVQYEARCTLHPEISADADSLVVTIDTVAAETITEPPHVNYDRNPTVDVPAEYDVYGGASSLDHDVETRFDWGDGSAITDWYPNTYPDGGPVTKTWTSAGTFTMTRQSRCIAHPEIISNWGGAVTIFPRDLETVSAPDAPVGPATGYSYDRLSYTVTGSVSSYNHVNFIQYRFDWGDGSLLTDWQEIGEYASHQYATIGDYEIKAQARCAYSGHDPIESEWSLPANLSILEEVTTGNSYPTGPSDAAINESREFTAVATVSDQGHALEYRFDWDDGSYSDWSASLTASHAWTTAGLYEVAYQARCAEHTTAVSDWSRALDVTVTDDPEAVTAPVAAHSPPGDVTIGDEITISAIDSESNYGHDIEYQIHFGDGESTPWTAAVDSYYNLILSVDHTYASTGSYDVTCQARCAVHPEVLSPMSAIHTINVYEAITRPAVPTGPMTGTIGENLTYTVDPSTSSEGHTLEYQFEYRRGTYTVVHLSDWSVSTSDTHVFDTANNQYRVRANVRCVEHPEAMEMGPSTDYITITAK